MLGGTFLICDIYSREGITAMIIPWFNLENQQAACQKKATKSYI